jgi:uncharacterized protein YqeY
MNLITRIEDELKQARLSRDDERRDALALILASLRSAQKELQRPLSEDEELQVLQRERKKRVEAFEAFEQADGRSRRTRRTSSSRCEEFMPEPLTEEDLRESSTTSSRGRATSFATWPRQGRRDAAGLGLHRRLVSQLVRESSRRGRSGPAASPGSAGPVRSVDGRDVTPSAPVGDPCHER